jgi:hypothetical protein
MEGPHERKVTTIIALQLDSYWNENMSLKKGYLNLIQSANCSQRVGIWSVLFIKWMDFYWTMHNFIPNTLHIPHYHAVLLRQTLSSLYITAQQSQTWHCLHTDYTQVSGITFSTFLHAEMRSLAFLPDHRFLPPLCHWLHLELQRCSFSLFLYLFWQKSEIHQESNTGTCSFMISHPIPLTLI